MSLLANMKEKNQQAKGSQSIYCGRMGIFIEPAEDTNINMKPYFMETKRLGFAKWRAGDIDLATQLWGDEAVTRFICADGKFTSQDIINRLNTEIQNDQQFQIQYWPIFERSSHELVGCCGLRPFKDESASYEIGFHLRQRFWGCGYASEAAQAVIDYGFSVFKANKLYAGHHPSNEASKKLLTKFEFQWIGDNFYEPTGLFHPSYELLNQES